MGFSKQLTEDLKINLIDEDTAYTLQHREILLLVYPGFRGVWGLNAGSTVIQCPLTEMPKNLQFGGTVEVKGKIWTCPYDGQKGSKTSV